MSCTSDIYWHRKLMCQLCNHYNNVNSTTVFVSYLQVGTLLCYTLMMNYHSLCNPDHIETRNQRAQYFLVLLILRWSLATYRYIIMQLMYKARETAFDYDSRCIIKKYICTVFVEIKLNMVQWQIHIDMKYLTGNKHWS